MGAILHCYSIAVRSYPFFLPTWVENDLPEANIIKPMQVQKVDCIFQARHRVAILLRELVGFLVVRRRPLLRVFCGVLRLLRDNYVFIAGESVGGFYHPELHQARHFCLPEHPRHLTSTMRRVVELGLVEVW
jgi:hypothetical protein